MRVDRLLVGGHSNRRLYIIYPVYGSSLASAGAPDTVRNRANLKVVF